MHQYSSMSKLNTSRFFMGVAWLERLDVREDGTLFGFCAGRTVLCPALPVVQLSFGFAGGGVELDEPIPFELSMIIPESD